jgi:hypothetical protein
MKKNFVLLLSFVALITCAVSSVAIAETKLRLNVSGNLNSIEGSISDPLFSKGISSQLNELSHFIVIVKSYRSSCRVIDLILAFQKRPDRGNVWAARLYKGYNDGTVEALGRTITLEFGSAAEMISRSKSLLKGKDFVGHINWKMFSFAAASNILDISVTSNRRNCFE